MYSEKPRCYQSLGLPCDTLTCLCTHRKDVVGFVEDDHLHGVGLGEAAPDHVVCTARRGNDDLGTLLQSPYVVANGGAANASAAVDVQELPDGTDILLDPLCNLTSGGENQGLALPDVRVDPLKNRNGGHDGLASASLTLGDDIVACSSVVSSIRSLAKATESQLLIPHL